MPFGMCIYQPDHDTAAAYRALKTTGNRMDAAGFVTPTRASFNIHVKRCLRVPVHFNPICLTLRVTCGGRTPTSRVNRAPDARRQVNAVVRSLPFSQRRSTPDRGRPRMT
jgi:hypothetical protein